MCDILGVERETLPRPKTKRNKVHVIRRLNYLTLGKWPLGADFRVPLLSSRWPVLRDRQNGSLFLKTC